MSLNLFKFRGHVFEDIGCNWPKLRHLSSRNVRAVDF